MQNPCAQCAQQFEITPEDLAFYQKVSPVFGGKTYLIPPPTLCPNCRERRRLSFRNERNLYHRKCDATGKELISIYSADKPYKIYSVDYWWSDKWDATQYGRDFDFSRPFFDQYKELMLDVPRIASVSVQNENCDFTSFTGFNKNCYLIYTADQNENCLYGSYAFYNKDTVEFLFSHHCELCYEVTDARKCYNVFWGSSIENCSDSIFLKDSIGCNNCIMCIGLRNKSYYYQNKPVSKERFIKIRAEILKKITDDLNKIKKEYHDFCLQYPRRFLNNMKVENCTGDYITNSRNLVDCYDANESEDCKYCTHIIKCKDSYDWSFYGDDGELGYELQSTANNVYNCLFCTNSWGKNTQVILSDLSMFCENCFGCVCLRHKKYCILNKQYTKEEYERLVPKIIDHMKKTRAHGASAEASGFATAGAYDQEWGEFFPTSLSPFAYNETIANEYYPLTKEQAPKIGAAWKEQEKANKYQGPEVNIPPDINQVSEDITRQVLTCRNCSKNYRIITQELNFYKRMGLPLSRFCPDCRHRERMNSRNPRHLYTRTCAKCLTPIQTTYAPDRPETVYCEKCYLEAVY